MRRFAELCGTLKFCLALSYDVFPRSYGGICDSFVLVFLSGLAGFDLEDACLCLSYG